jgi:hypothetical protein
MADKPINLAPEDSSELYSLYGRKNTTTNDLIQIPKNQFANAVGFAAADKGKTPYIDANGDYANLAAGTNGSLNYLASGIPAWLAPGTDGQVVGYSGGLPVAMDAPQTVRYVTSATASAAASIEFTTGFSSDYDEYIFDFLGVYPSTDVTALQVLISENAGSSYHATNYSMVASYATGSAMSVITASITATSIGLTEQQDNTAASGLFGRLNVLVSTTKTGVFGQGVAPNDTAASARTYAFGGSRATTARTNAIKFQMSSGNINGTIRMYRVKNS